jgi:photosystem II stability/assembly factor-like uncharacterized protein
MPRPAARCVLALVLAIGGTAWAAEPEKPKGEFGALQFRQVGPPIGGRISRVAGVPGDPATAYFAAAQGGVWKTEDGGKSFKPIMDDEFSASMGAIAIAPSDPNLIYVGGGEGNPRGNVMVGWGIWKSGDAGKTWQHVWKNRGQIGTLAVHPSNPDIAFASVLGSPFGPSDTRGVYRTADGGRSWQRVLFKDRDTGASDIAFDPNNPRVLFAGLWQMRRTPWRTTSGGPGSGLYRSADGGDTWKQITGAGLPDGEWGKVGVRIAPSDSRRVYALIEAAEGGLFRSDDAGESWSRVNAHRSLRQRAWYYSVLAIDPKDPDVVWFPQVPLLRTADGGRSITQVKGPHHGDHHDIWIDPRDTRRVISGNDGGVDFSSDGGKSWFNPDLPLSQFYNIDVDDRVPWHVGGTIQDWGTASGPNLLPRNGGVVLGEWRYAGGGEAADFRYDPAKAGRTYAGEYGGYLSEYEEGTGQYRNISVYPANPSGMPPKSLQYRFQWSAPFEISPHDPKVLYHGGNVLFRSDDRGDSWKAISGDLTRNDRSKQEWSGGPITGDITGVETYDTIFSIAESRVDAGLIWVGTDDGLVHLTRDGGGAWTEVTPDGMPEWGTVECVEPSRRDAGTAYVVVDARRLDDQRPHLFKTTDHGASWKRLGSGLPDDQPLFVVREDPTDANLLYLGGERGLWLSRDAGASWKQVRQGLPPIAVPDIEVKHDALVLGTRRGIWALDDLTPIRQFGDGVTSQAAHLFAPPPAIRWQSDVVWGDQGQIGNPAFGAQFTYWLKDESKADIKAEVVDADGRVIRTLTSAVKPAKYGKDDPDQPTEEPKPELTKARGLNRATWNLRMEGARRLFSKVDAGDPEQGPVVAPGRYTLRLAAAGRTLEQPFEVARDPRSPATDEQIRANVAFAVAARDAMDRILADVDAVRAIREQVSDLRKRTEGNAQASDLRATADAIAARCDAIEAELHNPKAEVVYDVLAGREGGAKLYSQMSPLAAWIQNADYAPTRGMQQRFEFLIGEVARVEGEIAALRNGDVARLEEQARALNLPRVIVPGVR